MRRRFTNNKEKYLSILALEDTTITVLTAGIGEIFAQINDGAWEKALNVDNKLSAGDVIRYKGSIRESSNSINSERGVIFTISNKVELFGDCTSIFKERKLFSCALHSAFSRAPITRVSADFLPAITLASSCYQHMFEDCTNLTTAPELPATTLADSCYQSMFYGCTKLNYIKAMFTTTPSFIYTDDWVEGVASTGTFIKNKNATWDVTATFDNNYIGIPSGWTVQTV